MTRADDIPDGAGDDGRRDVTWTGGDDAGGDAAVPAYGTESTAGRADRAPAEPQRHGEAAAPAGGGIESPRDGASEPTDGPAAEQQPAEVPDAGRVAEDRSEQANDGEPEPGSVAPPGEPGSPREPRPPREPRASDGLLGAFRRRLAGR